MEDTLSEVFTQCWGKLLYGSLASNHAFHTGVIGNQQGVSVNMRTVVLRTVDPEEKLLLFYTDQRSAKMRDFSINPLASWLFYDSSERVQVRLSGEVDIHHMDETTENHWQKVSKEARKLYMAVPGPSASSDHPADGLEHLNGDTNTEEGYPHFAVVVTRVNHIEWLSLKEGGHRRAEFRLMDNGWKGQWLIP